MVRAAGTLQDIDHPLDAEMVVSELLGSWWGTRARGADAEQAYGEGLIDYAAAQGGDTAASLLAGLSFLGRTRRQRMLAKRAYTTLAAEGAARPRWVGALQRVTPGRCYLSSTRFADVDDVVCTFDYGEPRESADHALIAVIDYNAGGVLRDAWVTTKVDLLLRRGRSEDPMATFTELEPRRARMMLRSAVARTEAALPPGSGGSTALLPAPVSGTVRDPGAGSLAGSHALLRSRIRALPGHNVTPRQPVWLREHRATLAARFLASPEAAELSDSYAASRCTDHIIDFGCDADLGRPLRISPGKAAAFLLGWLPRRVALTPVETEAMPHVLAAWIRWAGRSAGLPEPAITATLDTVWDSTAAFSDNYPDHAAGGYGLPREVVSRLIPDGDLGALARRMFAFPLLASEVIPHTDHYDPTTPAGRRALLRLDHFNGQQPSHGKHATDGYSGSPELEEALDQHEELARRLWDGDPPQLWSAAQRLLDRGVTRVQAIETLIEAVERAKDMGASTTALIKRLDDL